MAFEAYEKQPQLAINSYEPHYVEFRDTRATRQALEDSRGQYDSPTMEGVMVMLQRVMKF